MQILSFLKKYQKCKHEKVSPQEDICYCPDCGELIENKWYIVRCKCCGIKLKAVIKNGKIVPEEQFCHNCGRNIFEEEEISKINFIDINYAVLVKTVIQPEINELTQSWVNREEKLTPKLLTQT